MCCIPYIYPAWHLVPEVFSQHQFDDYGSERQENLDFLREFCNSVCCLYNSLLCGSVNGGFWDL